MLLHPLLSILLFSSVFNVEASNGNGRKLRSKTTTTTTITTRVESRTASRQQQTALPSIGELVKVETKVIGGGRQKLEQKPNMIGNLQTQATQQEDLMHLNGKMADKKAKEDKKKKPKSSSSSSSTSKESSNEKKEAKSLGDFQNLEVKMPNLQLTTRVTITENVGEPNATKANGSEWKKQPLNQAQQLQQQVTAKSQQNADFEIQNYEHEIAGPMPLPNDNRNMFPFNELRTQKPKTSSTAFDGEKQDFDANLAGTVPWPGNQVDLMQEKESKWNGDLSRALESEKIRQDTLRMAALNDANEAANQFRIATNHLERIEKNATSKNGQQQNKEFAVKNDQQKIIERKLQWEMILGMIKNYLAGNAPEPVFKRKAKGQQQPQNYGLKMLKPMAEQAIEICKAGATLSNIPEPPAISLELQRQVSNEARQQMLAMTASAARKDARLRALQNHFNGYSTMKASVAVRNIGEKVVNPQLQPASHFAPNYNKKH